MTRNERNLLHLGRSKRKNTQGATVRDTPLLEDDQNQMKTASSSNSTVAAGSPLQTLNIEQLEWVRNWQSEQTAGYQSALQLNRHTHNNEKCASSLKGESSRTKVETVSLLPKYVVIETNDVMSVFISKAA